MRRASAGLTDAMRFPTATPDALAWLQSLRQHSHAPRYNFACGDRLTAEAVDRVRTFERELLAPAAPSPPGRLPAWVSAFAERCLREVPIYRRRGGETSDFHSLPTCDRNDLGREPWSFVPDGEPLDDLMVYYTSGTSGRPIDVLSHPETAAKRIPLFRAALAAHGSGLDGGADRVAIAFVCSQSETLTYASISAYLAGAGNVKINLRASEWRDPSDRVRFLDACRPEVLTGDPLSFSDLAELPVGVSVDWKPRGMISSAMALLPATRQRLEERFGCPVVDLYSTCESGPIAFGVAEGRHRVLPKDLHVEVLDDRGSPCEPGKRGEVALTGGRNPFFPMLRYRTGDHASLEIDGGVPCLVGLQGREPVTFTAADGRMINNLDVTTSLRPFALAEFSLRQKVDGVMEFRYRGPESAAAGIEQALVVLFGKSTRISFVAPPSDGKKLVAFETEIPAGGRPPS